MRGRNLMFAVALAALAGVMPAAMVTNAAAQFGPKGQIADPNQQCQTIRTCRYERGGSFRGCLSTYTCRVCKFVEAKCEIGGRSQNCRELRCSWGG